jgi:hypothetical protein
VILTIIVGVILIALAWVILTQIAHVPEPLVTIIILVLLLCLVLIAFGGDLGTLRVGR